MPLVRRAVLTILAIALILPVCAHALGIEKGVKLGVNYANFRGEFADLANTEAKLGLVGGAFVALDFASDFAVQLEALYSMKGAKVTAELVDDAGNPLGSFDSFFNVSYLEVPLLLRGTILPTRMVKPMVYVGPTFGFSLGGKLKNPAPGSGDEDLPDLEPVDVGAAFGVGASMSVAGRRLLADLRYTTGFTDIYKTDHSINSGPVAESINSVFTLMVGVGF